MIYWSTSQLRTRRGVVALVTLVAGVALSGCSTPVPEAENPAPVAVSPAVEKAFELLRAQDPAADTFGFDTTGMGDVDGDGAIDLLLTSAWSAVKGARSGRMFLVSSR